MNGEIDRALMTEASEAVQERWQVRANIEVGDWKFRKPLHIAVLYDQADVVKFLLEQGANIQAVDVNFWSPLHIAYLCKRPSIIKLLQDRDANQNAKDKGDRVPETLKNGVRNTTDTGYDLDGMHAILKQLGHC